MSTHDMIIDNAVGATVRADINSALAALVSNSSSATEPATMYAYMQWFDTTTNILKMRNAANSAWMGYPIAGITTVASATTVDIFGAAGATINLTGTTTTTTVSNCTDAQVGSAKRIITAAAWPVTASASLTIDGATSGTTTYPAGAELEILALTTSTFKISRISGVYSCVRLLTCNGYGSTNTKIRRFTTATINIGPDITYADSAANGASFTINTSGIYAISYADQFSSASSFGVSLNSSQLTTNILAITNADRIIARTEATLNVISEISHTLYLAAGDVIRAHCDGVSSGTQTGGERFTISKAG